jgi:hypothetical protein
METEMTWNGMRTIIRLPRAIRTIVFANAYCVKLNIKDIL